EQLNDTEQAIRSWKRLLQIEPKNQRALRMLRDFYVQAQRWDELEALYGEQGDWEGLAEVLGHAAEKATEPEVKIALSFRAARVYEEKIGEPQRAFRSYERVLQVDPQNAQAARALLPIYRREERWSRTPSLYDVLIAQESDPLERLELIEAARAVAEEKLKDANLALRYALLAYRTDPVSESTRATLERVAKWAKAMGQVADAYEERLKNIRTIEEGAPERRWLRLRIAALAEGELGDVDRAVRVLLEAIEENPADREAILTLDSIFEKHGRYEEKRALFRRRIEWAQDASEKAALWKELARLEATQIRDLESALKSYKEAIAIEPTDLHSLEAMEGVAAELGRWDEVVGAIERQKELLSDSASLLSLWTRLGEVWLEHLKESEKALECFAEAIRIEPREEKAIAGLEKISNEFPKLVLEAGRVLEKAYEATGDAAKLRTVLEVRLASSQDAREKRELRLRIAELSVHPLGEVDRAYRVLESAFLDDPSDEEVAQRLADVAELGGMHEAHAVTLETALGAGDELPQEVYVRLARKAASIYRRLNQPEKAEPFDLGILRVLPEDEEAFSALRALYTDAERWADLENLFRRRIEASELPEERLELWAQLGFTFEELVGNAEKAIAAYEQALSIDRTHGGIRSALERLYGRTAQWLKLVGLLEESVKEVSGAEAAQKWVRIAKIYERELRDPQAAANAYEAALTEYPGDTEAQKGLFGLMEVPEVRQRAASILEHIFESQGEFRALVQVLEVRLEAIRERSAQVQTLVRIAEIAAESMGEWDTAFHAYARAVRLAPFDQNLREALTRASQVLAERAASQEERAAIYEARAKALEEGLEIVQKEGDLSVEIAIVSELAALWDEEAALPLRAEPWFERLYALAVDEPALRLHAVCALERIHLGLGAEERLIVDLQRRIELESDPSVQVELWVRLAQLHEGLGQIEKAIEAHRKRLDIDPNDFDALLCLERLLGAEERWAELVEVLLRLDALSESEEQRKAYALRAAEIVHRKLSDTKRAIESYVELLGRFGPSKEVLEPLIELYSESGRWQELLEAFDALREIEERPEKQAELLVRAAGVRLMRLEDPLGAIETYGQTLAIDSRHPDARQALLKLLSSENPEVRWSAARKLRAFLEAEGPSQELVATLDALADSPDLTERGEALATAASVLESMGEHDGAFERIALGIRGGANDPRLRDFVLEGWRLAGLTGKWLDYAQSLEACVEEIGDSDLQTEVFHRIAAVYRDCLEDHGKARRTLERLLELSPDDREALLALEALVEGAQDWAALLDVLRRRVEVSSGQERIDVLRKYAVVSELRFSDLQKAISALEEALAESEEEGVYAELERLYAQTGRWTELVALYERMLDRGLGNELDVRHRMGLVLRDRLRDEEGALEQFRLILSENSGHEPTIRTLEEMLESSERRAEAALLLEPVYLARLDWQKVRRTLEVRIESESDLAERKSLLSRLGQLFEDYLEDLDGAFRVYLQLFREDPRDENSAETLVRLARLLGRWGELAQAFRAVLEEVGVDDEATYRLALNAAQIDEQENKDFDAAIASYRLALRYAPGEKEPFEALERLFRNGERWNDLVELYEQRLDVVDSDEERLRLLQAAAQVERDHNRNAERAIGFYRRMLEIDPSNRDAGEALERLLRASERWRDLAELFELRIEQSQDGDEIIGFKRELAALLAERLNDIGGAIDLYESILAERIDDAESVKALERLVLHPEHQLRIINLLEPAYRASDQWMKLIAIHEAKVGLVDEIDEKVRLLVEVGELHELRGQNPVLAFQAYARAMAIRPSDEGIRKEVDRLGALLKDWDGLVQAYETAIGEAKDEPALQVSLLSRVAEIHDRKRSDPRAAIRTYERILEIEPEDATALDALEAMHTMIGDWAGLIAVLERKVERTFDSVERGELLRRAASVAEDLLGDFQVAVRLYERAVEEDDSDVIAYESLDRLYEELGQRDRLVRVLERRLELESDAEVRTEVALRLGRLAEEHLQDLDLALRAYEQVLADRPGDPEATLALSRLYAKKERWSDLLEVLRLRASMATHAKEQAEILLQAAQVLETHLSEVESAIATYREILAIEPSNEEAIQALIRLSAHEDHGLEAGESVLPRLEEQGRWDLVIQVEETLLGVIPDPIERKAHLCHIAEVHEERRRDVRGAFDAIARAIAEDPNDPRLVDELARLGEQSGLWQEMAQIFERQAQETSEAELSAGLWMRVAKIAEEYLGDGQRAIEAHRKRIEAIGEDEASLQALERLYSKAGAWREVADVLERQIAIASGSSAVIGLWLSLAELRRDKLGDKEGAVSAFREVLEGDPSEPRALSALEAMLGEEGLTMEIAEILER
ncbi:MAG: hypothetical protein N2515_00085, partial [Deltaproteobacteria bacterium]|nr:hypothetical protein [Deltaproteobacteria bacterium]